MIYSIKTCTQQNKENIINIVCIYRVLTISKFHDMRCRCMYAMAADSWHQPKVGEDGKIIWNSKMCPKEEDGSVSMTIYFVT